MSVRQIVGLKRDALQTRIDALSARLTGLAHKIERLQSQSDGLAHAPGNDGFQIAAMAGRSARQISLRLETERAQLRQQIDGLAREKLALDIADTKLEHDEIKARRVEASRADLREA